MGSFSIWHWLVVLLIVVLLFGTKKLGNIGTDLGKAIKGFKDGLKNEEIKEEGKKPMTSHQVSDDSTIDVEAKKKKNIDP